MTTYIITPICAGYYGPCAENVTFRDGAGDVYGMLPSMIFHLQSEEDSIIVDLSFGSAERDAISYTNNWGPIDFVREKGLSQIVRDHGIDPYKVNKIILTHGHFDHIGGGYAFPLANDVYLQKADFERFSNPETGQLPTSVEDMKGLALRNLHLLEGDDTSIPGIELKAVGGHSDGSQLVIVNTENGKEIIAGDIVMNPGQIKDHRPIGFGTGDMTYADKALDWIIESGLRCYYSHYEDQTWVG